MLKVCLVGVCGKMGSTIAGETLNYKDRVKVVSGVDVACSDFAAKSFNALGARVFTPTGLEEALREADMSINFSTPAAEIELVPRIARAGKNIVLGTTGFSEEQTQRIREEIVKNGVSAVISPNFSFLVNTQFYLAQKACELIGNKGYEFGIVEEHHSGKKDSPSGTAKKLAKIISDATGGKKLKFRGEEIGVKEKNDLEMGTLRLGGNPGQHELRIAGPYGKLSIETQMFSRSEFAKGAIESALWLEKNVERGKIFGMEDVLGLR
ncbi:4-hydroxy-tetrahydrodipicolinate reductase [Candidatus Micrarchaeota archaeon]|nr:4-hydroxy-tetrahydrodipicolinate reductase [Candidatus Micrarchaeota archaeon]